MCFWLAAAYNLFSWGMCWPTTFLEAVGFQEGDIRETSYVLS
jgi:hypothetical protein